MGALRSLLASTLALLVGLVGVPGAVSAEPVAQGPPAADAPVDPDRAFVWAAYNDFLDRDPSEGEMSAALAKGPYDATAARRRLVSGLSTSDEWVSVIVDRFYRDTLGRSGDASGHAYWVGEIVSGKRSVAAVAANFYSSGEYFNRYGGGAVKTWIEDLYVKILLRDGARDPSGVTYWMGETAKSSRTSVALRFYQSRESRRTRVAGLYDDLLKRGPDAEGWQYWADQIQQKGDLVLAAQLASSAEYGTRAVRRYDDAHPGDPDPDPVTVPGAPTGVTAVAGDAEAIVAWTAPGDDGGGAITGYTVTADPGGAVCTTTGEVTCVVEGLDNGTSYTFTVTATNEAGTGEPSAASNAVVPGAASVLDAWETYGVGRIPAEWRPRAVSSGGWVVGNSVAGAGFSVACHLPCDELHRLDHGEYVSGWFEVVDVSPVGEIVGTGLDEDWNWVALYWSSPSAPPVALPLPTDVWLSAVHRIDDDGVIYGRVRRTGGNSDSSAAVWADSTAMPTILDEPDGFLDFTVLGATEDGAIHAAGYRESTDTWHVILWPTADSDPVVLSSDLGPEWSSFEIKDVLPDGTIVGRAMLPSAGYLAHGVYWADSAADPVLLPRLTTGVDATTVPIGGLADGRIVGEHCESGYSECVPVIWESVDAAPVPLDPAAVGDEWSVAAVSRSGVITGTMYRRGLGHVAVVWPDPASEPIEIDSPVDDLVRTQVKGVAPDGTVVGEFMTTSGGDWVPVYWPGGTGDHVRLRELTEHRTSSVTAVGADGRVVGTAVTSDWEDVGVVWPTVDGAPVELATPAGHTYVMTVGVVPGGVIVGNAEESDTGQRNPIFWASPDAPAERLPVPAEYEDSSVLGLRVARDGRILGTIWGTSGGAVSLVWESETSEPVVVASPDGGVVLKDTLADGSLVGDLEGSETGRAAVWSSPTAAPSLLPIPSDHELEYIAAVGPDDSIYGFGRDATYAPVLLRWAHPTAAPAVIGFPGDPVDATIDGIGVGGRLHGYVSSSPSEWLGFTFDPLAAP